MGAGRPGEGSGTDRSRATRRGAYSTWLRALLSPPLGSPGGRPDTLPGWLLVVTESSGGVDSGSRGPGPRARPPGLRVAWGGQEAPEGEPPAEAAVRETKACACQGDWCRLCRPPGTDASRGAHLPRSLRPWRAELGLREPFLLGEAPPAGREPSLHPSPTSGKQYSWVGPEPRWGWAGRGRGGPRPGASSAAWNKEGA